MPAFRTPPLVLNRRRWAQLCLAAGTCAAQDSEEFTVYGEHPLLFLRPQRLRLLRRERERRSPRWQQFERLMTGRAAMPEEGFALALLHQATGDADAARRAVEWALGADRPLRELALVYDWCQAAASEPLLARLRAALDRPPRSAAVPEAAARALAAVALSPQAPELSRRELERIVRKWWRGEIVPALLRGRNVLPRGDLYALFELMHAIRDTLNIDLREAAPDFFKQLPRYDLISYYPASYPATENEFRIPAVKGAEPDLTAAAMSRAAELAMVAFDNNAVEVQYLQGWLMHDRFILRGALGAPYEYLWANPYQPGLSYHNLPLSLHDRILGRLFMRSRWDDDATWLGYFDGELQTFAEGEARILPLTALAKPVQFGDAAVAASPRFTVPEEARSVYIVGLAPSTAYDVEPDNCELWEVRTDPGGILECEFPNGFRGGIRTRRLR